MGNLNCRNCSEKSPSDVDNLNCTPLQRKMKKEEERIETSDNKDPFLLENIRTTQDVPTTNSPLNTSSNSKDLKSKKNSDRKFPLEIISEVNNHSQVNGSASYFLNDLNSRIHNTSYHSSATSYRNYHPKLKLYKDWKEYTINECISQKKMQNLDEEEYLLQGTFYKINSIKKIYEVAMNYVILTSKEIKVYRSKENFLYGKTPLHIIPLKLVANCDVIDIKETCYHKVKNVSKFNFCIQIKKDIKEVIVNDSKEKVKENDSQVRPKKMKLLEYKRKGIIDDSTKTNNNKLSIPDLLTFSSDDQGIVNKWVYSINYLISN